MQTYRFQITESQGYKVEQTATSRKYQIEQCSIFHHDINIKEIKSYSEKKPKNVTNILSLLAKVTFSSHTFTLNIVFSAFTSSCEGNNLQKTR